MDKLTLKNVRVSGKHGVYEEEKITGNDFEVDLIFHGDFSPAGGSDDLSHTIDYSQAAAVVQEVFSGSSVDLIERLAKKLLDRLKSSFGMANQITIRIRKLNPPMNPSADWAEIEISWPNSL